MDAAEGRVLQHLQDNWSDSAVVLSALESALYRIGTESYGGSGSQASLQLAASALDRAQDYLVQGAIKSTISLEKVRGLRHVSDIIAVTLVDTGPTHMAVRGGINWEKWRSEVVSLAHLLSLVLASAAYDSAGENFAFKPTFPGRVLKWMIGVGPFTRDWYLVVAGSYRANAREDVLQGVDSHFEEEIKAETGLSSTSYVNLITRCRMTMPICRRMVTGTLTKEENLKLSATPPTDIRYPTVWRRYRGDQPTDDTANPEPTGWRKGPGGPVVYWSALSACSVAGEEWHSEMISGIMRTVLGADSKWLYEHIPSVMGLEANKDVANRRLRLGVPDTELRSDGVSGFTVWRPVLQVPLAIGILTAFAVSLSLFIYGVLGSERATFVTGGAAGFGALMLAALGTMHLKGSWLVKAVTGHFPVGDAIGFGGMDADSVVENAYRSGVNPYSSGACWAGKVRNPGNLSSPGIRYQSLRRQEKQGRLMIMSDGKLGHINMSLTYDGMDHVTACEEFTFFGRYPGGRIGQKTVGPRADPGEPGGKAAFIAYCMRKNAAQYPDTAYALSLSQGAVPREECRTIFAVKWSVRESTRFDQGKAPLPPGCDHRVIGGRLISIFWNQRDKWLSRLRGKYTRRVSCIKAIHVPKGKASCRKALLHQGSMRDIFRSRVARLVKAGPKISMRYGATPDPLKDISINGIGRVWSDLIGDAEDYYYDDTVPTPDWAVQVVALRDTYTTMDEVAAAIPSIYSSRWRKVVLD